SISKVRPKKTEAPPQARAHTNTHTHTQTHRKMLSSSSTAAPATSGSKEILALTKRDDRAADVVLNLWAKENHTDLLCVGPRAIQLMGMIILLATKRTVDLDLKSARLVKYPTLRPNLLAVVNMCYKSFTTAEKNMSKLQMRTGPAVIPAMVVKMLTIIAKETPQNIKELVPDLVDSIKAQTAACVAETKEVVDMFNGVMDFVAELSEVMVASDDKLRKQAKEHEDERKVREMELAWQEDALKRLETEIAAAKADQEKAEKMFEQVSREQPSGWETIGMALVEALPSMVNSVASFVGPGAKVAAVANAAGAVAANTAASQSGQPGAAPQQQPAAVDENRLLREVPKVTAPVKTVLDLVDKLEKAGTGGGAVWKNVEETTSFAAKLFDLAKTAVPESAASAGSGTASDMKKLIDSTSELFEALKTEAKLTEHDPAKIQSLVKSAAQLKPLVGALEARSAMIVNSSPLVPAFNPTAAKQAVGSAVQQLNENWRTKLQISAARLEQLQNVLADKSRMQMEADKRRAELSAKMSTIKFEEMSLAEMIKILQEAFDLLQDLRQQWRQLLRFFEHIQSTIDTVLRSRVESMIGPASKIAIGRLTWSDTLRDLMYDDAVVTLGTCNYLSSLASTYVEISHAHYTTPLNLVGKLISLDPSTAADEIARQTLLLKSQCDDASTAIADALAAKTAALQEQLAARRSQVQGTLAVLYDDGPAAKPPAAVAAVEKAVKESAAEARKEIVARFEDDQF
ncbi:hypothetical protein DFJ73DRAFT_300045, partial [Zopfochytrium polystomum]